VRASIWLNPSLFSDLGTVAQVRLFLFPFVMCGKFACSFVLLQQLSRKGKKKRQKHTVPRADKNIPVGCQIFCRKCRVEKHIPICIVEWISRRKTLDCKYAVIQSSGGYNFYLGFYSTYFYPRELKSVMR
jgi:hypothetical protein